MVSLTITDNQELIVELSEDENVETATWGVFFPEGHKHPLLALVSPPKDALFQNFWDEEGIKNGREILGCLTKHGRFWVMRDNEKTRVDLGRKDRKVMDKMFKMANDYNPRAQRG